MRVRRSHRFAGPNPLDVIGAGITAWSSGNLVAGLSSLYDTIEVRTAFTPPAVINLHEAAYAPPGEISPLLKPTIILSGPNGRDVIAPYGEAEGGWGGTVAALVLILGAGFVLGRLSKR